MANQRSTQGNTANSANFAERAAVNHLPKEGTFDVITPWILADQLAQSKFSGYCTIRQGNLRRRIHFVLGEIVRIQSNLEADWIGQRMRARNWLANSDIETCLQVQRQNGRRFGDLVTEVFAIDSKEIEAMQRECDLQLWIHLVMSSEGSYTLEQNPHAAVQPPLVQWSALKTGLRLLVEPTLHQNATAFEVLKPWMPTGEAVELSKIPMWQVLAGCRRMRHSGILRMRHEATLIELVLKNGLPMIFYQGTFAQPRQKICVRATDSETELHFQGQLWNLLLRCQGSALFQIALSSSAAGAEDESKHDIAEFTSRKKFLDGEEEGTFTGVLARLRNMIQRGFNRHSEDSI